MELVSVVVLAWALEVRDSRFRKACGSKHPGREVIPVGMNLLWALVDHLVGLFLLHLYSGWLCLSACGCGAGLLPRLRRCPSCMSCSVLSLLDQSCACVVTNYFLGLGWQLVARPVFIVFPGLLYPEHLFTSWLLEFQLHIFAG